MPLAAAPVGPVIPVSDLDASRAFYEGKLGLTGEETPGGWVLHSEAGSTVFLLPAPEAAGQAGWPLASFRVEDIANVVDALRERGVEFMHHGPDLPFETDKRGVSAQEGIAVAWLRDPDGQVLTLFELR